MRKSSVIHEYQQLLLSPKLDDEGGEANMYVVVHNDDNYGEHGAVVNLTKFYRTTSPHAILLL